jgi:hypothetical protein
MRPLVLKHIRAFLGRRSRRGAEGNSMGNTGPESTVPRAASGAGGAGFLPQKVLRTLWGPRKGSPAGAGAGEGRA